jgi:uncharacterized membrane protein
MAIQLSRNGRRLMWVAFLAYLGLFVYTVSTGDPTARFALDVVFILIMIAFSWFAYQQLGSEPLGYLTAGALAGAAVAEAVAIFTSIETAGTAADVLLIAGLVLYVYVRRTA